MPRPIVRGQSPDDMDAPAASPSAMTRLQLPAPDHLGIEPERKPQDAPRVVISTLDWSAVRRRLDDLGVTCFQVEKMTEGYRFSCVVPMAKAHWQRRLDVIAATETEAVVTALREAEKIRAQ